MNKRWITNHATAATRNAIFLSYWIDLLFKTVIDFEYAYGHFKTSTISFL